MKFKWSKASRAVNLVCDMVLRKYVCSCLKADGFLPHSYMAIGKVTNIFIYIYFYYPDFNLESSFFNWKYDQLL